MRASLVYKGQRSEVQLDAHASTDALFAAAARLAQADDVRIIFKGKLIEPGLSISETPLHTAINPKLMVMASAHKAVADVRAARSDPTIRGFEAEEAMVRRQEGDTGEASEWGGSQDAQYKFCRLEMCTWQSFGTRPSSSTPHAFAARSLLVKLSHDPAVVAIMRGRRWTVGVLAEMDPLDDRLAEKMEGGGKRLLGYNMNSGSQIHIRLRDHDLSGFMPYSALVDVCASLWMR